MEYSNTFKDEYGTKVAFKMKTECSNQEDIKKALNFVNLSSRRFYLEAADRMNDTLSGVKEMSIGDNVRKIREQRQIPQKQLAELVEVSPSMISQIERGTRNPSLQIGKAIADVLGCTMDDLLGAEESG